VIEIGAQVSWSGDNQRAQLMACSGAGLDRSGPR
jgi:hypothetical protein